MHRNLSSPTKLWITGGTLVFFGAAIPFFMILDFLQPSFLLLGIAALASIIGTFLGLYATSIYMEMHRRGPRC